MIVFAIIFLVVAAVFIGIGIAVYRGRTDLIHEYHQEKVDEDQRRSYGKAFSAGLFAIAAGLVGSGVIALADHGDGMLPIILGVLLAGLLAGLIIILLVQKKYNGGVF